MSIGGCVCAPLSTRQTGSLLNIESGSESETMLRFCSVYDSVFDGATKPGQSVCAAECLQNTADRLMVLLLFAFCFRENYCALAPKNPRNMIECPLYLRMRNRSLLTHSHRPTHKLPPHKHEARRADPSTTKIFETLIQLLLSTGLSSSL